MQATFMVDITLTGRKVVYTKYYGTIVSRVAILI